VIRTSCYSQTTPGIANKSQAPVTRDTSLW
jgi:hypothetical protein